LPGGGADDVSKIIAILKSRTLTENVIDHENLMPILFEDLWDSEKGAWKEDDPKKQPNMEKAVFLMHDLVRVADDKINKTIKISGEFADPQAASRVVNAYLDELQNFINANAFTVAKRNRLFIEGQLEQNKRDLLESGKEINEFYNTNKISNVDAKVNVPINKIEARDSSETLFAMNELSEVSNGIALPNPELQSANAEIDSLMAAKGKIDQKIEAARVVKNVPQQVYLNYVMLRRELLAKVNALLTTQYEMAKIEEAKEDLSFQIIDRAVPPVMKYKPKRSKLCIMSFVAAIFLAVFLAFFREYLQRMRAMQR
jgi:uncharacterized protein involved in exopolysaccharide biosynthesis